MYLRATHNSSKILKNHEKLNLKHCLFQRNLSKNSKICIKITSAKRWIKSYWRKTDHKSKFGFILTWSFLAHMRIFPISCRGQKAQMQGWPDLGTWASWTVTINRSNSTVSRKKSKPKCRRTSTNDQAFIRNDFIQRLNQKSKRCKF